MSRFGVLVMGPAGAGKTTFCSALLTYLHTNRRSSYYINLDPAAEEFSHEPNLDIRDLMSLDDAMTELGLGPNGGLLACLEYLLANMDFITDALEEEVGDDVLVVIDMPGQIELYTHVPILPALARELSGGATDMRLCAAYLLEGTFIVDRAKFFAGTLAAMSAMLLLGLPHVNILSKMDLVQGTVARKTLRKFFEPGEDLMVEDPETRIQFDNSEEEDDDFDETLDPAEAKEKMTGKSFARLNQSVARLIQDFGMVSYLQLNAKDEDSVGAILSYIDDAIQYNEAQEPKEPKEEDFDEPEEE